MSTAAPSTERRHCWTSITTTDGITICGTIDAGWYVLGPQNAVLAKYPDDGGITSALIRYRIQQTDEKESETR